MNLCGHLSIGKDRKLEKYNKMNEGKKDCNGEEALLIHYLNYCNFSGLPLPLLYIVFKMLNLPWHYVTLIELIPFQFTFCDTQKIHKMKKREK